MTVVQSHEPEVTSVSNEQVDAAMLNFEEERFRARFL